MRTNNVGPGHVASASARCASVAAHTASVGRVNAAANESPAVVKTYPPFDSIAVRRTVSCTRNDADMASLSVDHQRVEPSMSVNKNVTVPVGRLSSTSELVTGQEC